MRTLLFSSTGLAVLCLSAPALAATAAVDELVITATRLPAAVDQVTGARVIDRAEIEARQSVLVTDLLATVPGVGISRSGAFGGVANISIRGANPDKTLVLVDGVPLGDPSQPQGNFDASSLLADDIERIEVLSGPQGSLWGSEAIGGVIAITTREVDGLAVNAEAGSFDTARGSVQAGVRTQDYAFSAAVNAFRTDGISKADTGIEDDGNKTFSAQVAGRAKLTDTFSVNGRIRFASANTDLDGYPFPAFLLADTTDRYKSRTWSGVAGAQALGLLGLDHNLSVSAYDITRRGFSDFPYRYTADRQVYRWTAARGQADAPFSFVLGAERTDSAADLDGRDTVDLGVTSAFGVGRARLGERLALTGSVRYDDPDKFKGRATARLSAAGELGAGFTLTASAGQGFKIPTISQVTCDFCFPPGPSLGLKPEKAEGYDLRLGWVSPDQRFSAAVTAYRLNVRDQISYGTGRYSNIAKARSTGVEAEAEGRLTETLRFKLSYAVMDAIDVQAGVSQLRVPDHSGAAILIWADDRWSGAFTVRGESSQTDTARDGFSPVRRKGFVTADLAGAYEIVDGVSITARIENLADERYQETFGYGEPGRALYVGFRLKH